MTGQSRAPVVAEPARPGTIAVDLGYGVTVVTRIPPDQAKWPGGVWVAPYSVNCAEHGWLVSRATIDQAAAEGREHRAEHRAERIAELRRAVAAGMAGILVTQHDQLCSGGREPILFGARAYEDADGWVYCPEHIPGPSPEEVPA